MQKQMAHPEVVGTIVAAGILPAVEPSHLARRITRTHSNAASSFQALLRAARCTPSTAGRIPAGIDNLGIHRKQIE